MSVYSYIGKGTIYMRKRGAAAARLPIGNCSKLELGVTEEKKDLPDYQNPGGGKANSISRVSAVTAAITAHDLSPANMALALRGGSTAVTAGAVTDEQHTAYKGGLVTFNFVPNTALSITVADAAGSSPTTTYVAGTDYMVTRAGIVILAGGAIDDGDTIYVDYTKVASNVIETLTTSGDDYEFVFDGLNEAASGKAVIVSAYRAKFSPASGLGLIGDEFAGLELTAELLKDETITGTGLSQYLKIRMAA